MLSELEEIAVGQYLSDWPDEASYEAIKDVLYDSSHSMPDGYGATEHFEDWYVPRLMKEIDDLLYSLNTIKPEDLSNVK